jgi:hypothetical protein
MNPELLSSLAAEHRRGLGAAMTSASPPAARAAAARGRRPARSPRLPRLRLSWSHTTLGGAAGGSRGGSVVIVISATRTG